MWRVYPPVSGGKLRYRNRGPWLVLAKTSSVTYKIQHHAKAEPEFVHVHKLLPYQADFEEELHSCLHGEESDGQWVAETQTADNMPSELPPEAAASSPSPTQGSSLDFGLVSDQDADVESDTEETSTLAIQPRPGLRPRQTPDHYASVRSIRSMPGLSHDSSFSTPMLLDLLLAASTRCPDVKPAVVAEEWTSSWESILILLSLLQVMSWTRSLKSLRHQFM